MQAVTEHTTFQQLLILLREFGLLGLHLLGFEIRCDLTLGYTKLHEMHGAPLTSVRASDATSRT